jgi:hypothetical protein
VPPFSMAAASSNDWSGSLNIQGPQPVEWEGRTQFAAKNRRHWCTIGMSAPGSS